MGTLKARNALHHKRQRKNRRLDILGSQHFLSILICILDLYFVNNVLVFCDHGFIELYKN